MAEVKQIVTDIKQEQGNFINIGQICKYTGWGRKKVKKMMSDTDGYRTGREVKYLAIDIARAINFYRMNKER